jgi:hypothetical protein
MTRLQGPSLLRDGGRVELVEEVHLLAEAGGQHQVEAGRQGGQGFVRHPGRQGQLDGSEGRFGIEQLRYGLGLGHLGRVEHAPDHPLHLLLPKRDHHQAAWKNAPFQLGGQVVMEHAHRHRQVDGDLDVGGHRFIVVERRGLGIRIGDWALVRVRGGIGLGKGQAYPDRKGA